MQYHIKYQAKTASLIGFDHIILQAYAKRVIVDILSCIEWVTLERLYLGFQNN